MARLGQMASEGFSIGLEDLPDVAVRPPVLGGAGGRGAGVQVHGPLLHLEVHAEGDPEMQANAIRSIVLPELAAAFEQLALESGVA
jgi:hypothetical protein